MSDYYKTRETKIKADEKKPIGMREEYRFQLEDTSIKLRKTGMLSFFQNGDNQASLVNLSKSGLQLMLTETLKKNDNYQINLYAPGCINPLIMKARVIWCRPYKKFFDKTYYRVGFRFVKINEEVVKGLKKLEQLASKNLKRADLLNA